MGALPKRAFGVRCAVGVVALAGTLALGAAPALAVDTTAPTITSSYAAASGVTGPVNVGGVDYFGGQVLVTFVAHDAGSGVNSVFCSILPPGSGDQTFAPANPPKANFSRTFDFNTPGGRGYSCTATDAANNTSAPTSGQFFIDTLAPTTTATAVPSIVARNGVTVNLSSVDTGVGVKDIRYRINGGSPTTVNGSSTSITLLNPGTYTIDYQGRDKLGNTETQKTITVYVDRTRPAVPTVNQYFTPVGQAYDGVLSGTAHDNIGVARVDVTLEDAIGTIDYTHTFQADCNGCGTPGNQDVTWSLDLSGELPAAGNYIATITVTDLAGNTRTVSSAAIVVVTDVERR